MAQNALTLEQINQVAPSVFSTEASHDVSNRYSFIPTSMVLESLMREGWEVRMASQSQSRTQDGQMYMKHMLRLRQPGLVLNVGDVLPEIVLINSHNRGCAYQMHAGLFRLVCSNGMVVADATFAKQSIKHSGKILDEVRMGADMIVKEIPHIHQNVIEMQGINLDDGERLIFAKAARMLKFEDDSAVQAEQLLNVRRYGDEKRDLWTTFNVIQENILKGGLNYRTLGHYDENGQYIHSRGNRTRPVKNINEDLRLNKALWSLSERMIELKTA